LSRMVRWLLRFGHCLWCKTSCRSPFPPGALWLAAHHSDCSRFPRCVSLHCLNHSGASRYLARPPFTRLASCSADTPASRLWQRPERRPAAADLAADGIFHTRSEFGPGPAWRFSWPKCVLLLPPSVSSLSLSSLSPSDMWTSWSNSPAASGCTELVHHQVPLASASPVSVTYLQRSPAHTKSCCSGPLPAILRQAAVSLSLELEAHG